jgi:hypothetical protein
MLFVCVCVCVFRRDHVLPCRFLTNCVVLRCCTHANTTHTDKHSNTHTHAKTLSLTHIRTHAGAESWAWQEKVATLKAQVRARMGKFTRVRVVSQGSGREAPWN